MIPRDQLAHERVVIAPHGAWLDDRAGVLQDGTLSVGSRLTLELLTLAPVLGRPGLRDLRIALGVAREKVIAYLDELYRRGLVDVEVRDR